MENFFSLSSDVDVYQLLESFVFNESLVKLVESFGGKYTSNTLEQGLAYLLQFSDCWDYRSRRGAKTEYNENARWLIEKETFSQRQKESIDRAKEQLGLVNHSVPQKRSYDYVWVLGGAKLSCLLRTRLAADVCATFHTKPIKISLLGSSRPINDSERLATDTYAPNAQTEFDLFIAAHDSIYGKDACVEKKEEKENSNSSWKILEYADGISVLSAPSSDPVNRRANSTDTYLFFIDTYNVQPHSSILLVTSEIYVPYQHLEAFRTVGLKHKVNIETIGFPASWGGALQGMNSDENYLQEIRSTIQSLNRLLVENEREH